MKNYVRISVLLSCASAALVFAETTEFRTPQRLTRGEMHWPLKPVEEAWWYDKADTEERDIDNKSVDVWAAYYGICAGEAFFKPGGGITTDTASLSALWFGKDTFRGQEVLAGNPTPAQLMQFNVFLGFAKISPTFSYSEKGAVFGLRTMRTFGCEDMWHTGFRVSLPVKKIDIEQDANIAVEETLQDVMRQVPTNQDPGAEPDQVDFAYRLDFLSALGAFSGADFIQYMQYGPGDADPLTATWFGGQGGDLTSLEAGVNDTAAGVCPDIANDCYPVAYAIRANGNVVPSNDCCCPSEALVGIMPTPPFYRFATDVVTYVREDGSGGVNGNALFFKFEGQDYASNLANDTDAQGALFIVPRAEVDLNNPQGFELTQASQTYIYNTVDALLDIINPLETASFFFEQQGIDLFAHEHIVGVGDLTVEWFIGYGDRYDWYVDGVLGAIFPTGTNPCSAKQIFHKPTGNNRHYEIKVGSEGGYNWCDMLAVRAEAFFGHAFNKTESRAAVFKDPNAPTTTNNCCNNTSNTDTCATFLKNIGTPVCVDVSWNWFYGRLDFTVFHPYNSDLGLTFGYEFYWKSHDHIDQDCGDCNTTATPFVVKDFFGNDGTVDFCAMERNSQVYSNKLYGEIFHRWYFFELFAGASQIVSGENVMKETEAHLGLRLYF
jgi:hypothetical protein